jgi:hypothetical protein
MAWVLEPLMPIRYLLSGGMSVRGLMPGWTCTAWRAAESGPACAATPARDV